MIITVDEQEKIEQTQNTYTLNKKGSLKLARKSGRRYTYKDFENGENSFEDEGYDFIVEVKEFFWELFVGSIDPRSTYIKYWNYAALFDVLLCYFLDLYILGYSDFSNTRTIHLIRTICSCTFLVHLHLCFRLGIWGKSVESNTIILNLDLKKIANRYLKTFFIWDVLIIFPFHLVLPMKVASFAFLATIPRILGYQAFFNLSGERKVDFYGELFQNSVAFLLLAHLLTCLQAYVDLNFAMEDCTIKHEYLYQKGSSAEIYLGMLSTSTQYIADMGSGETSCSVGSSLIQLFTTLIGMFVFCTILGNINSFISFKNLAKSDFLNSQKILKNYLSNFNLDKRLEQRCEDAFTFGFVHQEREIQKTMELLPQHIQHEIKVDRFRPHLEMIPCIRFMNNLSKRLICIRMKSFFLMPQSAVVRQNEKGNSAYIFLRGAAVYGPLGFVGTGKYVRFNAGNIFGQAALISKETFIYEADCIAMDFCEIVEISQDCIWESLQANESDREKFKSFMETASSIGTTTNEKTQAVLVIQRAWRKYQFQQKYTSRRESFFSGVMQTSLVAGYILRESNRV